jgi:carboxylesterase type B
MPPRNPPQDLQNQGSAQPDEPVDKRESTEQLLERIRLLEAELSETRSAKELAEEESARLSAQAQTALFTSSVVERFSRKAEDGTDLWWYRIDLSPSGGTEIRINGFPYYHGSTYELSTDLLRSIKEIVARTWDHENNIMGANENMYRREQNRVLRGGERRH